MHAALLLLGIGLFLATLPGSIELLLLTIGALFSRRTEKSENLPLNPLKTAVFVPAHNEALHILLTIESLKQCEGEFDIIVIADNCSDNTADIAKNAHVRTLERNDLSCLGKHHALNFAFSTLLIEGYEIFTVVDADTYVEKDFIISIQRAFQKDALAVQVCYVLEDADITPLQRLSRFAFSAYNVVRPLGREKWGLSAGLFGNGFALSRTILLTVPFTINSIVEDAAYHLKLVQGGYRVRFLDQTQVIAVHPPTNSAAIAQKSRWEGGRWCLLKESAPLLCKEIAHGNVRLIEPLLDLLLFPLAMHTLLLATLLFIPNTFFRLYAATGLGILFLHIIATLKITKGGWKDVKALCLAPFYLLWKLTFLSKIAKAAKKGSKWNRTDRK